MKAKINPSGSSGKANAITQLPKACVREKRQEERVCQRRCREANREKRLELARLRQEADLNQAGKTKDRHKAADRKRLQGKGLFYCASPVERAKEIQRRLREANQET